MVAALLLVLAAALSQSISPNGNQNPPVPAGSPGSQAPRGSQSPARDNAAKPGTARIRGHVFAADSGQPLRKAQIRAFSSELRENRMASTDANGAYELKELPGGRYTVTAAKGSFVSLSYGQLRPFENGKPIEILDGQTIERVNFALPPGSVITGHIVDEFGDPIADAQVMAMRYQFAQGRRSLFPAGRPAMTNDIGEFRLFALPPGQYYLSATMRNMAMMADTASDDRSGYAPTYYPGTPNVAEAQRVSVSLGQTVTEVNIGLVQTRTARLSGIASDSTGKPLSGGFIMILPHGGVMMMGNGGGQIRPDGTFSISGVAPGEYVLQANLPGSFTPGEGETAVATVSVNGEDISGIQLMGTRPVIATGRIVVDPAQAKSLDLSMLRITASPASPDDLMMGGGGGSGKVNDDFTFEIKARPGQHLIRLFAPGAARGWTMKTVRYNGVDVTDTAIDFRSNAELSGIEIELTNRSSEISGLVTDAHGALSRDYTVVIFAQDSQRWGYMSRYVSVGRPDQDGRFKVRALPAGRYCAVALDYVDAGEATDPEFLERVRQKAVAFSLDDGATKALDLRINSAS